MNETGLKAQTIHAEPTEEIVQKFVAISGKAVIWAGTPFCNKEEAIEVAHLLDQMAKMAEPYGIKIGYHNHSQEFYFDQGQALLEHLLDNSEKCFVKLDCGWAMNGDMYPPYFIRKYKNRIISIHVKENSKVVGPGERPASRKEQQPAFFPPNVEQLPVEERQKILDDLTEQFKDTTVNFSNQCKMGAEESNLNWKEIKAALEEQDFAAYWVVEREGFYDDHDKCIADDCAWLKENL